MSGTAFRAWRRPDGGRCQRLWGPLGQYCPVPAGQEGCGGRWTPSGRPQSTLPVEGWGLHARRLAAEAQRWPVMPADPARGGLMPLVNGFPGQSRATAAPVGGGTGGECLHPPTAGPVPWLGCETPLWEAEPGGPPQGLLSIGGPSGGPRGPHGGAPSPRGRPLQGTRSRRAQMPGGRGWGPVWVSPPCPGPRSPRGRPIPQGAWAMRLG